MTDTVAFTQEQLRAIGRREGSLLLSAGAGTGKTSVLVERFVRAVLEDDVAVESILAITFTEKAAGQLTGRVRRRFLALNAPDRAREAEGAWISTIHGFCARVLRTHALTAGLDPEFVVLDGLEAERIAIDAFDRALRDFVAEGEDPERLRLLASYTPDKLADMVRTVYGHLRSRGQLRPELPEVGPPVRAAEHAILEAAITSALVEIEAADGAQVITARGRLERCAQVLAGAGPDTLAEPADLAKLELKGTAKALKGPACEAYGEAIAAYATLCASDRAYRDHVLLRALVADYGVHYARLKRERSGLDFDDLELLARDLLAADTGVRAGYEERFAHVLVDEFQDTNPLQNEILDLLTHDNLFRVGDERQSIYRFRHADVGVFRRHRDTARATDAEERITVNFRSDQAVLDAVDLAFSELWGPEFETLKPPGDAPVPTLEPQVELLVTDGHKGRWDERFAEAIEAGAEPFGDTMRDVTPWRAAEARLLAKRIDELVGEGRFRPGEVVVLLRATTSIGVYERAFEERGLPTYVLGGRGYWSQQQVADLRAYLAALANPLDELALHSVLASPLVGVSLDALVLLAATARRQHWDVWRTVEALAAGEAGPAAGELAAVLPDSDRRALVAFAGRFDADRRAAPRVALEALIDRAVTLSGYDRAVLAMPAGDRRMANIRKLMRMAREYEADAGRDLRGFIDFVAERDLVQEREGQAALDAEDLDAVRLMTIHRAKGLEFPLVCVADLGKTGREDDSALRVSENGQVGLRLASMGGGTVDTDALTRMRERQKEEDEEEERRIMYVAATRAERHLILSGATDLDKLGEPRALDEPMRWIWRNLRADLSEPGPAVQSAGSWEGRAVAVRTQVLRPEHVDELLPAADRIPEPPEHAPAGLEALAAPALAAVDVPDALPGSRLSYSGLEAYRRCGYRFYLERALRLPRPDDEHAAHAGIRAQPAPDTLPGTVRGSAVHVLLEDLDFHDPVVPSPALVSELLEGMGQPVRAHEVEEIRSLIAGFARSDVRTRLKAATAARTELPFAFTLDTGGGRTLLVDGIVDVHATEG
ncbi:MAG: UvrD-helicase domain-containing protein, partial [Thermoleophilaceae bacterium]